MAVSRISTVSSSSSISQISAGSTAVGFNNYKVTEKLDFSELPLLNEESDSNKDTLLLQRIIYALLHDIVLDGCRIVSRGALAKGQQKIEASFKPPANKNQSVTIYIPLPGVREHINPIDHTILPQRARVLAELSSIVEFLSNNMNNNSLVKLIILISHEYGHFISYRSGNHNYDLRYGLSLLHSNEAFTAKTDHYAYQVFSEELTAWEFAADKLAANNFNWWPSFEQVKINSLKFYYQRLNLKASSIDTYCKLSMRGVDLARIEAV